jgi:monofunctional biosynthetic peptidoglycan transglycosylase
MQQRMEEARDQSKKLKIDHRWVSLGNIPKHVRRAVLIAEDARFFDHAGIDWHEIGESFETNWEEGRIVRGGSTITQQLAKNLYLSTSRDPIRKFKELIIAWMLEATLSKKRILELYLNIIEWGRGVLKQPPNATFINPQGDSRERRARAWRPSFLARFATSRPNSRHF